MKSFTEENGFMAQPEIGFTAEMARTVKDSSFALFVIFGKKLEF